VFIISREALNSAISLRENIADPEKKAQCVADVESMIRTKESHLARAEWGSCCGNLHNLAPQIDSELKVLQRTLEALTRADFAEAASLMDGYLALLTKNYRPEPDHW